MSNRVEFYGFKIIASYENSISKFYIPISLVSQDSRAIKKIVTVELLRDMDLHVEIHQYLPKMRHLCLISN